MKILEIRPLSFDIPNPNLDDISNKLDELGSGNRIGITPWPEYSYKPDVRFNIGYRATDIFLKYYVQEEYIRAVYSNSNENVWEDSCVELFISHLNESIYYNFEFNCIGTCLVKKGISRNNRFFFEPSRIQNIKTKSSLGRNTFTEKKGKFSWDLTIAIPLALFFDDEVKGLKGKKMSANFYKCGDSLSKPHFVTWNTIDTDNPDFHRPEYFGEIYFL